MQRAGHVAAKFGGVICVQWRRVRVLLAIGTVLRSAAEMRQTALWCGRRSRVVIPSEANFSGLFGVDGATKIGMSLAGREGLV